MLVFSDPYRIASIGANDPDRRRRQVSNVLSREVLTVSASECDELVIERPRWAKAAVSASWNHNVMSITA
jgi:hypothetical protein